MVSIAGGITTERAEWMCLTLPLWGVVRATAVLAARIVGGVPTERVVAGSKFGALIWMLVTVPLWGLARAPAAVAVRVAGGFAA